MRCEVLIYDGCDELDALAPWEVLEGVARERDDLDTALVSLDGDAPVRASHGTVVMPHRALSEHVDMLVVPGGGWRHRSKPGAWTEYERGVIPDAIRARHEDGALVASVCTGAMLLAAAGLLDGRRATTHWQWEDLLQGLFPAVAGERDSIFVVDRGVYTSAGVTAGMDLALALVEEDLGPKVARDVAQQLVIFLRRPGGQSQFSSQLSALPADHEPLRDLQAWIPGNVGADLSVPALAERVAMSPRNFARTFRRETGMTPAAYVESVRVEQARIALESSDAPVETVASECGFGTVETMRRAFHRRLGVGPAAYRSRFQSLMEEVA